MTALQKHMPDAYKQVARALGYTLLLGGADDWHGLTVVLTVRLTPKERVAMAWAALRSLTLDQIVEVVETVLPDRTGRPISPLFTEVEDAAFWADMAEPTALEAYCLASFNAMPAPRQTAFLDFVLARKAA